MAASKREVVLSQGGTTLVVDVSGPHLPRVLHWGSCLGDPESLRGAAITEAVAAGVPYGTMDEPLLLTLLPGQSEGWSGRPGVSGHRGGNWPHLRLRLTKPVGADGSRLVAVAADREAGVEVTCELRLSAEGVIRARHTLRNVGDEPWSMDQMLCLLPLPARATDVLDLSGRWCRERSPQRRPLAFGTTARESRRGRTGHDATLLLMAGTPGFSFETGQVWACHVGWSGNHLHLVDRQPEGETLLGGGELLLPGEVQLAPGQTYQTPWTYFGYSAEGLNGLGQRFHQLLRARPEHPVSPRPVVLNTWEAVYFDHNLDRLTALAERAAEIGVERFVLDDGWFLGRRDATAGLGDWYVDPSIWPEGLHPLVTRVRALGMEFGLWVEPEMVNPDSALARQHPDWMLAAHDRPARPARDQQVLDLARPEAFGYLRDRLDALVGEYKIDFLKWDHNRDLLEAVHQGRAGVSAQTHATYRLMSELRARHPHLEIESCSSGGARIDLGILAHTDRVWPSDTNDPLERQSIQAWTGLLVPPELIGTHIGPPVAHTTHRAAGLRMRCVTALFGHAGLEWDITTCDQDQLAELGRWIDVYKELRGVLHSGTVVRADHPDPSGWLHGVVAPDRHRALFAYVQMASSATVVPPRLCLPGLDPDLVYQVAPRQELAPDSWPGRYPPTWVTKGATMTGAALQHCGLACPILYPTDALVLDVHVTSRPSITVH